MDVSATISRQAVPLLVTVNDSTPVRVCISRHDEAENSSMDIELTIEEFRDIAKLVQLQGWSV